MVRRAFAHRPNALLMLESDDYPDASESDLFEEAKRQWIRVPGTVTQWEVHKETGSFGFAPSTRPGRWSRSSSGWRTGSSTM